MTGPRTARSINPVDGLANAFGLDGEDQSWAARAACAGDYPEFWFPVERAGRGVADYTHARAVCSGCQVRAECLDYAIRNSEAHGVWGGLTPRERDELRRRGGAA
jgi:WhiB family redox-sensing transcriptional regulator